MPDRRTAAAQHPFTVSESSVCQVGVPSTATVRQPMRVLS